MDSENTNEVDAHPSRSAHARDRFVAVAESVAAWIGGLFFLGLLGAVLFMIFGFWAIGVVIGGGALYALASATSR